ncbi:MAG: 3-methyl-2-oxobutanoate hydroxymethyltransferase [Spirochaetes bacterium]|nr:MAG: 3-methyl-2-oxobutanoate hydroxymethyltransferase [Spirochaetota bacterium]
MRTINDFKTARNEKRPISMITCYDFAYARLIEQTEIDTILVGDSLGNVFAGYSTTVPVTLDQMIYHTEIVRRGAPSMFVIADLPFMSYHVSIEDTMRNCGRVMKETGANAVKLEGGRDFAKTMEAITKASIPVVGHLGLTPQSVHKLGGFTVQGREEDKRRIMIEDAKTLEQAGVFCIVLEMVPEVLAKEITESISIPTIGIGAGRYTSGQVLVINDLLGVDERFKPKFLKKYVNLADIVKGALAGYHDDVVAGRFPAEEHAFK